MARIIAIANESNTAGKKLPIAGMERKFKKPDTHIGGIMCKR